MYMGRLLSSIIVGAMIPNSKPESVGASLVNVIKLNYGIGKINRTKAVKCCGLVVEIRVTIAEKDFRDMQQIRICRYRSLNVVIAERPNISSKTYQETNTGSLKVDYKWFTNISLLRFQNAKL